LLWNLFTSAPSKSGYVTWIYSTLFINIIVRINLFI
jgi:hypothetical protein